MFLSVVVFCQPFVYWSFDYRVEDDAQKIHHVPTAVLEKCKAFQKGNNNSLETPLREMEMRSIHQRTDFDEYGCCVLSATPSMCCGKEKELCFFWSWSTTSLASLLQRPGIISLAQKVLNDTKKCFTGGSG